MAQRVKAARIKLIIQVQHADQALQAAALGADVIVAQVIFPVQAAPAAPCPKHCMCPLAQACLVIRSAC
jgi:hypothetical protein